MALILGTALGDLINATSTSGDEARGLEGNDTLYGGPGSDMLNGNQGSDLMYADSNTATAGGNDSVYGGTGNDTVIGARFGFGGDVLNGNKGDDIVVASQYGSDTAYGGQDSDTLYGHLGGHDLIGNLGNDLIYMGAQGSDRGFGSDGDDTLVGGSGSDILSGEGGKDTFIFQAGTAAQVLGINLIEGGYGGTDTIADFSQGGGVGDQIKIDELDYGSTVNVKNTTGGVLITIAGTARANAEAANQTIFVQGANVAAMLGVGADDITVNGVVVNTTNATTNVDGSYTYGVLTEVSGKTINGTDAPDDIGTSANPNSQFNPTTNNDTINGNGGDDVLDGLAGNDILNGGTGSDTLYGNTGADTLTGGSGADQYGFRALSDGVDTITDFASFNGDVFRLSASGFGGTLFAGGNVISGFAAVGAFDAAFYTEFAGAPPADAATLGFIPTNFPSGLSVFYYDAIGGGLYFDADGGALGTGFVKFAQLSPAPGFVLGPAAANNEPFATFFGASAFVLI